MLYHGGLRTHPASSSHTVSRQESVPFWAPWTWRVLGRGCQRRHSWDGGGRWESGTVSQALPLQGRLGARWEARPVPPPSQRQPGEARWQTRALGTATGWHYRCRPMLVPGPSKGLMDGLCVKKGPEGGTQSVQHTWKNRTGGGGLAKWPR